MRANTVISVVDISKLTIGDALLLKQILGLSDCEAIKLFLGGSNCENISV